MNNVLLLLLPLCQLLQALAAPQMTGIVFDTTTPMAATTTNANRQCVCYLGTSCPTGTTNCFDVRIVNNGTFCPAGYSLCYTSGGGTNNPSCGIRMIASSPQPGQATAPFGAYPWQVALLNSANNSLVGGGVLISSTRVLTVAHKVCPSYVNGGLKARLGEWDAQSTAEPYPYEDIIVDAVNCNSQYNAQNLQNDIAVLRLRSAAPNRPNINTACLPTAPVAAGTSCWVTGWGKDAFGDNGRYQSILKQVDVTIRSQADCQADLRRTRLGEYFILANSFICAGGQPGKDACTGDGGSPLVCGSGNGPYQVVGLVTWGIGCATGGVPGVYTNVYNFLPYINSQL